MRKKATKIFLSNLLTTTILMLIWRFLFRFTYLNYVLIFILFIPVNLIAAWIRAYISVRKNSDASHLPDRK